MMHKDKKQKSKYEKLITVYYAITIVALIFAIGEPLFGDDISDWCKQMYKQWNKPSTPSYPIFADFELGNDPKDYANMLGEITDYHAETSEYRNMYDVLYSRGTYKKRPAELMLDREQLQILVHITDHKDWEKLLYEIFHTFHPEAKEDNYETVYQTKRGQLYVDADYYKTDSVTLIYTQPIAVDEPEPASCQSQTSIDYYGVNQFISYAAIILASILVLLVVPANDRLKDYSISKIKVATNTAACKQVRDEYAHLRTKTYWVCACMLASICLCVCNIIGAGYIICAIIFLLCFILYLIPYYKRTQCPVKTLSIQDINGQDYCLFLRGFSTDNYFSRQDLVDGADSQNIFKLLLSKIEDRPNIISSVYFEEYTFTNALNKTHKLPQVVAIGMTKELEAPLGAKRVYFDDDKWKEGVHKMMDDAKCIFILVNGRANCVFETSIALQSYLNKTVFIIDKVEDFEELKQACPETQSFNDMPQLQKRDLPTFMFFKNNEWCMVPFLNVKMEKGVRTLLEKLLPI